MPFRLLSSICVQCKKQHLATLVRKQINACYLYREDHLLAGSSGGSMLLCHLSSVIVQLGLKTFQVILQLRSLLWQLPRLGANCLRNMNWDSETTATASYDQPTLEMLSKHSLSNVVCGIPHSQSLQSTFQAAHTDLLLSLRRANKMVLSLYELCC